MEQDPKCWFGLRLGVVIGKMLVLCLQFESFLRKNKIGCGLSCESICDDYPLKRLIPGWVWNSLVRMVVQRDQTLLSVEWVVRCR